MARYPEFKDKVVLVTGGGGGLGKATAIKMAKDGCRAFIGDIRQDAIDEAVEEIKAAGADAAGCIVDVTSEESVENMVNACMEKFGRVDYLVAAAGIYKHVLLENMTFEEWQQTIDINLSGVFLVTRKVINQMLERGHGSIVVFNSQAGIRGSAKHTHYGATKGGLSSFVRCLMYEVADRGVRVNAVAPGVVMTHLADNVDPARIPQWLESIPMGRFGEPEEIANVVAFLLSDEASYVTGQTIPINGGSVVNT